MQASFDKTSNDGSHASRTFASIDRKFAFWITNTMQVLRTLQHIVTESGLQSNASIQSVEGGGLTARLLLLLQMRSESAQLVEELYRAWVKDLNRWFSKLGQMALLEHQGLPSYASEMRQRKPSLLGGIFGGSQGSVPSEVSIDVMVASLEEVTMAMADCALPAEIAQQVLSHVLNHVCAVCFNQLLLRKNYATWRRGIQIQYNLSQLEEWANRVRSGCPGFLVGPPPLCQMEPLLQAVKLLQLAKTATMADLEVIVVTGARLSVGQIKRLLSVYVPDEFEDGPVAPALLRALTLRCQRLGLGDGELMQEVAAEEATLQLSIVPHAPADLAELPTCTPPRLWKLFVLDSARG